MADHLKPTITSTYSNFVTEMDARFDDLAVGLDPAVTSATNVPTEAIRWSSASNKWQKFNGTAWGDLSSSYNINISGNANTVTDGIYTTGTYSNPTWLSSLSGSKITGDISGNAGSATQLATARNINGVAFNGTAAISINLNNSITFNNSGTGSSSGITFNGGNSTTVSYNTIGSPSSTGANASGTWGISITGNAATASIASDITTAVLSKIYPVGSVYVNASNNTNPSVLLGFGTWVAFGSGRVMVGIDGADASFDTLEETGGSKNAVVVSHSHSASTGTAGSHNHIGGTPTQSGMNIYGQSSASGYSRTGHASGEIGYGMYTDTVAGHTHTVDVATSGVSGVNANLQPYITVAMWKRTE